MDERVLKPGGGALIKVCRVPGLQERLPRKFASAEAVETAALALPHPREVFAG